MSQKYVIDASFFLSHLLPDEERSDTEDIFDKYVQGEILFVSSNLLKFEVVNAIWVASKRKRIEVSLAKKLVRLFKNYEIKIIQVDINKIFDISIKNNITVYDASYVYLSKTTNYELLTLDKKLKKI